MARPVCKGVDVFASDGITNRAPWMMSLRGYLLLRLVIPSSFGLLPVVTSRARGQTSGQSRPRRNVRPSPIAATSAVAFSTVAGFGATIRDPPRRLAPRFLASAFAGTLVEAGSEPCPDLRLFRLSRLDHRGRILAGPAREAVRRIRLLPPVKPKSGLSG
jgi:hypothetical protein